MTQFPNMQARAAAILDRLIDDGARLAASQPWRIGKIIRGEAVWPSVEDGEIVTVEDDLALCRRLLADERERHQAGHWTRDFNRLTALRQAEAALIILRGEDV